LEVEFERTQGQLALIADEQLKIQETGETIHLLVNLRTLEPDLQGVVLVEQILVPQLAHFEPPLALLPPHALTHSLQLS
jgi:hypothetical protein